MCGGPRPYNSPRYPDYVCVDCVRRAVDETGGAIDLSKASFENPIACFIDGVRCRADEAYSGGIVVRPTPNA